MPTEENLREFGGTPEDYESHVQLLPCMAAVFYAFCDLRTQWAIGPHGGAVGLIYSSIPVILVAHDLPQDRQTMRDILTMESAALAMINQPLPTTEGGENAS